jgi:signal transduction histidine kinase
MNRSAAIGQMSASIAHEIKQPLAAIVMNAGAGLRWLAKDAPNVEEAAHAGAWRAALRARPRVFRRAPERLSALRPPLNGVSEAKRQSPDAEMRARERGSVD